MQPLAKQSLKRDDGGIPPNSVVSLEFSCSCHFFTARCHWCLVKMTTCHAASTALAASGGKVAFIANCSVPCASQVFGKHFMLLALSWTIQNSTMAHSLIVWDRQSAVLAVLCLSGTIDVHSTPAFSFQVSVMNWAVTVMYCFMVRDIHKLATHTLSFYPFYTVLMQGVVLICNCTPLYALLCLILGLISFSQIHEIHEQQQVTICYLLSPLVCYCRPFDEVGDCLLYSGFGLSFS